MKPDTYEGVFEIADRTAKAIKVIDTDSGEEIWLPWSQIEEVHGVPERPGHSRIVMTRWIAAKKGLLQ